MASNPRGPDNSQEQAGSQPIVALSGISKSFDGNKVLDSVSLKVMREEFVAIVGKSGSGKSTLLNIIGLLDQPDKGGQMSLFGSRAPKVGSQRARHILRNKLGYLFQNAALIDQDTADENMRIAQRFSSEPRSSWPSWREAALAKVGLEGMGKHRVFELSGGEQQRLAVACLLLQPSELILADEPTGSLDPTNRDVVLDLLANLRDQGKTVVIVTHDPLVSAKADRVISLDEPGR